MGVWVAAGLLVVLLVVVYLGLRGWWRPAPRPQGLPVRAAGGRAVVTLDVQAADPASPVVSRLVDEAAARVFASLPEVEEVEVLDRAGALLGRRERRAAPAPEVRLPGSLLEPHHRRHAPAGEPSSTDLERPPGALPRFRPEPAVPGRPLADYFDLPPSVRAQLRDPDDPVDLLRAILEAGGHRVEVSGEVLRIAEEAVVVLRSAVGQAVDPEALNRAYLLFARSGARRGVVVSPGLLYPAEVRRREALAPALLHTGPEGIQRMADAVALGADPLRFAAAPPLVAR